MVSSLVENCCDVTLFCDRVVGFRAVVFAVVVVSALLENCCDVICSCDVVVCWTILVKFPPVVCWRTVMVPSVADVVVCVCDVVIEVVVVSLVS